MQAPIVKIIVRDGEIAEATFYTPTLPDGAHDLYCDPGEDRIQELEKALRRLVNAVEMFDTEADCGISRWDPAVAEAKALLKSVL